MTRLEIAKQKLKRLENELEDQTRKVFEHAKLTNGQPLNDKRNGYKHVNKQEKLEDKIFEIRDEIKKQKERIEYLEEQEINKELGLNRNGSGLALTIDNIDKIKAEIDAHKNGNSRYSAATIRKYKKKLKELEEFKFQKISDKAQKLIDSGKINQWKKQPKIYFVKGYRKVAVELNEDGHFEICSRYKIDDKIRSELLELIR